MAEIIITSSVLILVIAVLRRLLRGKFPLRLQYALWALVAVRLLIPVSFAGSAFSVLNAAPAVELPDRGNIYLSDQGITAQQPPPQIGYAADSSVGADGERIPGESYAFYYAPDSNDWTLVRVDEAPPEGYTTVPASRILPTPKAVLTAVWWAGMAAMGGWFLWVNLSFRKRLRASARKVELPDCPLPVFVAEGLPSPCLFGLLRPAIYVTPACLEDKARLRHVLAHEATHARHGDQLWSAVRCLCLTVYWFHPLVWLAAALSRRDCELACDEGTLKRLGEEERIAYGRTLISLMAESASPSYLLQTATTMVDRKRGIKERLLLIAKKPMTLAITTVAVVLIAGIAAACTFTGAAERSAGYATVEEALADLPEELRPTDSIVDGIAVCTPEDESEFPRLEEGELFRAYSKFHIVISSNLEDPLGWMASVYRMDQAGYDALTRSFGLNVGRTGNSYWECFAKDSDSYYLIYAPITAPEVKTGQTEGAELQKRLIAWIKEAVLSVQGVTAFDGERLEVSGPSWPTSAQQEELEALQRDISVRPGDADWPEDPTPDALAQVLAQKYFSAYTQLSQDNPMRLDFVEVFGLEISDMDDFDRPTEILFSCSTAVGQDRPHIAGLGAGPEITYEETGPYAGKWVQSWQAVIAKRDAGWYFDAIGGGMTIDHTPAGPAAAFTGTAEEAFRMLLSGDNSLLDDGRNARAWLDFNSYDWAQGWNLDYFLLDVDNDGVPELVMQHPDSPATLNGVFDYRDGAITCWRFDIMDSAEFQYALMDGTMVFEFHFGDMVSYDIFRYTPDGEREDLNRLFYRPDGYLGSGEPASWEVDYEPVTEEEFDHTLEEWITSRRVAGGRGIPVPDLAACRDDLLMDFLLNVADGAYAEGAQYELGERFLARPGDILSTMTRYRGAEATRWPDRGGDKADQLVWMLVSEFKVMRYGTQDADQFLAALGSFAEDDYDGMVRSVREAWDSRVLL